MNQEVSAIIDQNAIYEAGIKFRHAREKATPSPLFRFAESKGFSEGEAIAEQQFLNSIDEQIRFHNLPRARVELQAADDNFSLLILRQIERHPTQIEAILSLARAIRAR